MVKQLSNAKPKKKRHAANSQKVLEKAVAIPAIHPITFAPTNAGIRPYLSAIKPKSKPPHIAPIKNIL